ncbi:hypothetical protein CRE_13399 [Caenorhabditis remanei]|uniref:Core Histone H2A/H2B/H3 domain-containing protein n=1 Tax=Caenorhabditis remanei TaxID=31234 RepID=E3M841_CAERE|nr:hypothetical protein CRE_13399 [Caenorhabditis remanei]
MNRMEHNPYLIKNENVAPSRSSSIPSYYNRNSEMNQIREEIEAITSRKNFNRDSDSMQEVIDIMTRQINKWEQLEDDYGPDATRQRYIEAFQRKRDSWEKKKEQAERAFYERRDRMKREMEYDNGYSRNQIRRERRMDDDSDSDVMEDDRRQPLGNLDYSRKDNCVRGREAKPMALLNRDRSRSRSPLLLPRQAHPSTSLQLRRPNIPSTPPVRVRPGKSRVTKSKNRKWRPGQKALLEIRKYQKSTDMLIQKAPFARLVQEILRETTNESHDYRIRADALMALQEGAEAFMVEMFEGSVLISNHAKRVTLMPTDVQLYRRLCLRNLS